jgi:hypothetical protein
LRRGTTSIVEGNRQGEPDPGTPSSRTVKVPESLSVPRIKTMALRSRRRHDHAGEGVPGRQGHRHREAGGEPGDRRGSACGRKPRVGTGERVPRVEVARLHRAGGGELHRHHGAQADGGGPRLPGEVRTGPSTTPGSSAWSSSTAWRERRRLAWATPRSGRSSSTTWGKRRRHRSARGSACSSSRSTPSTSRAAT